MTKVVIMTKLMKNKKAPISDPYLQSYIITFHSSPVDALIKVINALWKFQKFVYSSITSPDFTS